MAPTHRLAGFAVVAFGMALLASAAWAAMPSMEASSIGYSSFVSDAQHIRASRNGGVVELVHRDNGLVVASVPRDGFFGLRPGDVVVRVQGSAITTTDSFTAALEALHADQATFNVRRAGATLDVRVPRHHGFDLFL